MIISILDPIDSSDEWTVWAQTEPGSPLTQDLSFVIGWGADRAAALAVAIKSLDEAVAAVHALARPQWRCDIAATAVNGKPSAWDSLPLELWVLATGRPTNKVLQANFYMTAARIGFSYIEELPLGQSEWKDLGWPIAGDVTK